ncbi:MAG: glycosyltransferase [Limnohabitans sp.]|jgi:glycosyltransferase involved in cell wall biosynthesis|nr:glycosyltransferase [Limnohabitans sp.]
MNAPAPLNLPTVSVVVPMYNEIDNVAPLVQRFEEALGSAPWPWELLLVDDGSTDGTTARLREVARQTGDHIRVIELARNFKQTAAMQAGIDAARGDVIVTLDGDLQNDPLDIPLLVERLLREDLDLVAGWRKDRKDGFWLRKVPSRIANRLIARLTGVRLNDYGCSLKAFRASCLRQIRLYGEMHRFIPAWIATVTHKDRIAEQAVRHHPRIHGESKYGISRTFRVILDLLFMYFIMRFRARPGHFFGLIGLGLMALGSLILGYLFVLKLMGESIGSRPLLTLGFFLMVAGVQMLSTGILAEVLVRVLFESGGAQSYWVRDHAERAPEAGWRRP